MSARQPLPIARPEGLRLQRAAAGRAPPPAPFGLGSFRDDGAGIAVVVEMPSGWSPSELADLAAVLPQIPTPETLPSGTLVVVLGTADRSAGLLPRLFGGGRVALPRALRATALLARGYTDLGAGIDPISGLDLAWGYAPGVADRDVATAPSAAPR